MASSSAVKLKEALLPGAGGVGMAVSGDFEAADFPGYDRDVQRVFRSLGAEYDRLCEVIAAEDPDLDPAYEESLRLS